MNTTYAVIHKHQQKRFEIAHDDHTAVLDYILSGETITFTHTGVPAALEGRGIGSALVKEGLAYARTNQLKVIALCWFVEKYMQRHPEA
jgi:predicted GNAT family acetyltransferase